MALHATDSWTLGGLVGAFVHLAVAYFLLCGSVFAFFASKILGFFGLCLPCLLNGIFGFSSGDVSLQELLFDWPRRRISAVKVSAKSRFPFDSLWVKKDEVCHVNLKLIRDKSSSDCRAVEFAGEACCSSASVLASQNSEVIAFRESGHDVKSNGVLSQKPRYGVKRRRPRAVGGCGKFFSVSSSEHSGPVVPQSSSDESEVRNRIREGSGPGNEGEDGFHDDGDALTSTDLGASTRQSMELIGHFGENKVVDKDSSSAKAFVNNVRDGLGIVGNKANEIRLLEQALEEEKAACAALYLELEKERAAAATAADEAMAMILRLQKDKALMEMEARQYQRIIEEKSAYDEEEMNTLKEILVKKEKDKHFLEMEVEAYRQMMFQGNEQVEGELHDMTKKWGQTPLNEDLELMQHQIIKTTSEKEMGKNVIWSSNNEAPSVQKQSPNRNLDCDIMKQINLEKVGKAVDQIGSNFHSCMVDTALNVHDIHVIDDKTTLPKEGSEKESESYECTATDGFRNCALSARVPWAQSSRVLSDLPGTNMAETEQSIHRSNSNMSSRSLEMVNSQGKTLPCDPGRASMPAFSNDRLKIDAEIEWLREKLREVLEGRERFSFSFEQVEGGEILLKLLEEIADQLQELQRLTEPGKAVQ